MLKFIILAVFSFTLGECLANPTKNDHYVTWLHAGENYTANGQNELGIFCHCGDVKSVISLWRSAYVEVKGATDFTLFEAENGSEVLSQYKSHMSSWILFSNFQYSHVSLPTFQNHCIGITSSTNYNVQLHIRKIDFWRSLRMLVGAVLFISAPNICRNLLFYYASGISIGVFASVLLLFFILSRLIPKKSVAYSVLVIGGSFTVYIFQKLWSNFKFVCQSYSTYLISYLGIAALISFAVCYKYQPMTDSRSQNLIQWSFQLMGLALVFFSSEFHEISMAIVLILIASYNMPAPWIAKIKLWWKRRFPPKIKLLTESEYMEQTNRETKKAIEELRKFCDSPDCKTWKYVSRLKNPVRFANFVDGGSHLTDDEILRYDSDSVDPAITDDYDEDMSVEITDDEQ